MTKDELVNEIIKLLREHKAGRRGSIHQNSYKRDFFNLFAAAFNAGMMRPGSLKSAREEALIGALAVQEPELLDGPTWETLRQFWSEWTYAWDQADKLARDEAMLQ